MVISQEPFDALLVWLDADREAAGRKYETIRAGLVRVFVSHGFHDAEDLADLTINRVVDKVPDISNDYVGEPARYFHGVARNVIHEARRRKEITTDRIPERLDKATETTDRYECLLRCLDFLPYEKRELILDYYLYDGRYKIEHRRRMAKQLELTDGALRTRAHHIRAHLETCVVRCAKTFAEKQKTPWKALLSRRRVTGVVNKEQQP